MKEYMSKVILEVTWSGGQYLGLSAKYWNETVSKYKEGGKSYNFLLYLKTMGKALERTCQGGQVWTVFFKSGLVS